MTREHFIAEVKACQGRLRRFLASLCSDASLADDLAQEALVRAYVNSGNFSGNFKAWVFRIAYNCFIDNLRRVPGAAQAIDSPEVSRLSAEANPDAACRREELQRALALLPEKERSVIVLHYFEDLPIKEIAAIMQIAPGTVKYYLSVGRDHLRQYIRL